MIAVRVMQMPADQVIDVIAVRHRFMAAAGAVYVILRMPAARVLGGAIGRILLRHLESMLLDLASLRMMQMPVVEVIRLVSHFEITP